MRSIPVVLFFIFLILPLSIFSCTCTDDDDDDDDSHTSIDDDDNFIGDDDTIVDDDDDDDMQDDDNTTDDDDDNDTSDDDDDDDAIDDDDNDSSDDDDDSSDDDDDDTSDDDSSDDDDDDTVMVNATIEKVEGELTGYRGMDMAVAPDDTVHVMLQNRRYIELFSKAPAQPWSRELIHRFGNLQAITTDRFGNPHMSFFDTTTFRISYANNVSGTWVFEQVGQVMGNAVYNDIAVDGNGYAHIIWHESDATEVYYSTNISGAWITTQVEAGLDFRKQPSITAQANGVAHLAYLDAGSRDLKYATNASGTWTVTIIDHQIDPSSLSGIVDINLDSSNTPHITYACDQICHATKWIKAPGWYTETIQMDEAPHTSVMDSNDVLHVASSCIHPMSGNCYANNSTGNWVVDQVGPGAGYYTLLGIDSIGHAHMVFADDYVQDLDYVTNESGSWVTTTLQELLFIHWGLSGAIDAEGNFHSIFMGRNQWYPDPYFLYYASDKTGQWETELVDDTADVSGGYRGMYDVDVDSGGNTHTAYVTRDTNEVRYAHNVTGTWVISTIVACGTSCQSVAIKMDSFDKTHIVYSDSALSEIRHATNQSGFWTFNVIAQNTGTDFDLVIDSSDNLHLIYDNSGLHYAFNSSGIWNIEPISCVDTSLSNYALRLDAYGYAHIVSTSGYYYTNISGSWQCEPIGTGHLYPDGIGLAMDDSGYAHVTFFKNDYFRSLKYATNQTGVWETAYVDTFELWGQDIGLVHLDDTGSLHILYEGHSAIWYATFPMGIP